MSKRKFVEVKSNKAIPQQSVSVKRESHASGRNLCAFRSSLVAPATRPWFPAVARVRQLLISTTKIAAPKRMVPTGCPKIHGPVTEVLVFTSLHSLSLSLPDRTTQRVELHPSSCDVACTLPTMQSYQMPLPAIPDTTPGTTYGYPQFDPPSLLQKASARGHSFAIFFFSRLSHPVPRIGAGGVNSHPPFPTAVFLLLLLSSVAAALLLFEAGE